MKRFLNPKQAVRLFLTAAVLWSLLGLFTDFKDIAREIRHVSIWRLMAVFILSAGNYWLRIIRFNWLSKLVAKAEINEETNSMIFLSGLSMNLTPARVGEVVKAYYQQKFFKESFARMAPIPVMERLADGISMLILMSFGVLIFKFGILAFGLLSGLIVVIILCLHQKRLMKIIFYLGSRVGATKKISVSLERALDSFYRLSSLWPLILSSGLGVAAWAMEASGLWIMVGAVGVPNTISNLYLSLFIFSIAAAAGFLAIIPAGLGINEISTIGLLERLIKINYPQALVVTFVFRLVTLWFGIFLGLASILYLERRLKNGDNLE
ncbi:flippase-like domain-containing protein [Candidatus Collierbacteria bacterium]|nr:flippase-like domain-containing protein [Candidatus Collierbacteria bacterium]